MKKIIIVCTLAAMAAHTMTAQVSQAIQQDTLQQMMNDSTYWKTMELGAVTVKGQRPKTKLTGNSMITRIQGSALEKSGTLKEMLAKVPGMTQKGDDIEVVGKGTPVYYINGRKMQDKDELKRLRSEEIKEVEVITNPGAQYDATVSAVVRIKTIRRKGTGFGYDIDLSNEQNLRYGYYNPGATLNLHYRYKNVEFFGMANYWKWNGTTDATPTQTRLQQHLSLQALMATGM